MALAPLLCVANCWVPVGTPIVVQGGAILVPYYLCVQSEKTNLPLLPRVLEAREVLYGIVPAWHHPRRDDMLTKFTN